MVEIQVMQWYRIFKCFAASIQETPSKPADVPVASTPAPSKPKPTIAAVKPPTITGKDVKEPIKGQFIYPLLWSL